MSPSAKIHKTALPGRALLGILPSEKMGPRAKLQFLKSPLEANGEMGYNCMCLAPHGHDKWITSTAM